jgi:WD40 repeat protein
MKVEGEVTAVAISSDGQYIAAGITSSAYGGVYLFSRDNDTPLWSYMTGDEVDLVSFSADGQYIAVASYDTIYLFNRESENPLWSYTVERGAVESLAISSDGHYTTVGVYYEGVYLFSRDTGMPLWSYTIQEVNVFPEVHISSDGKFIIAANNEKIYLFTRESGTPRWSYDLGEYARSISLSSDGHYIAVGSDKENHGKVYLFGQQRVKSETVTSELTVETTSDTTEMIDTSINEKWIDEGDFYKSVYPYLAVLIIGIIAASIGGLFYMKSSHLKKRRIN